MKRKDKYFWCLMGALLSLPAMVFALPVIKPGSYQTCCNVVGVNCNACHTYACCMTGCTAGYSQSTPPMPCALINCSDACCAAAGTC